MDSERPSHVPDEGTAVTVSDIDTGGKKFNFNIKIVAAAFAVIIGGLGSYLLFFSSANEIQPAASSPTVKNGYLYTGGRATAPDGSGASPMAQNYIVGDPSFSADGKKAAYVVMQEPTSQTNYGLDLMIADGDLTRAKKVIPSVGATAGSGMIVVSESVALSSDASTIAYAVRGTNTAGTYVQEIKRVNVNGSGLKTISFSGVNEVVNGPLVWKGTDTVLYVKSSWPNNIYQAKICSMLLTTSAESCGTPLPTTGIGVHKIEISPNGNRIAWVTYDSATPYNYNTTPLNLSVTDLQGANRKGIRDIKSSAQATFLAWSPDSAFVATAPNQLVQPYAIEISSAEGTSNKTVGSSSAYSSTGLSWRPDTSATAWKGTMLVGKQCLATNQYVTNNGYTFGVTETGIVMLANSDTGAHIWSTGMTGAAKVCMEVDGNLVARNASNAVMWQTNTAGAGLGLTYDKANSVPVVTLTSEGPVVGIRSASDGLPSMYAIDKGLTLWRAKYGDTLLVGNNGALGEVMPKGTQLTSANGVYKLRYQADGNLAVYDGANKPTWSSGVFASSNFFMPIGSSFSNEATLNTGIAVTNYAETKALISNTWKKSFDGSRSSNSVVPASEKIKLGNDGNVVAYGANNAAIGGFKANYTPVQPVRLLDTREKNTAAMQGRGYPLGPTGGQSEVVSTLGRAGLPSAGVSAVVVNVTAVGVSGAAYLTVAPAGTTTTSSSVNTVTGRAVSNQVTTLVNASGNFVITNYGNGLTHVIVDIVGYYSVNGDGFTSVNPTRITDTRANSGQPNAGRKLAAGGTLRVVATERAGVPKNATGAVVNITTTETAGSSFLAAYPTGAARPNASSMNIVPNENQTKQVNVKLGADGSFSIYNHIAATEVVVDVVGYFAPKTDTDSGYVSLQPSRLVDTRAGGGTAYSSGNKIGGGATLTVDPGSKVPKGAKGIIANVTAVDGTNNTFLRVYPTGVASPNVSQVNYTPPQVAFSEVSIKPGADGKFVIYNHVGAIHVIVDVVGYYY